ncbi:SDR family NAD(P)-dependent oxidoreductase [Nocardia barduliensis]|uniref:SDR family NAD(P)-dependent oxidoreductase n=1 Tax=Nocardia barduliensis TaxID=2736643 RepID=UPI0015720E87|nr:SDR family oxidoreductase [Nocardia barduliensis]
MTRAAVLVTGASRGIGLGIAERLAAQGTSLTIAARRADALEAVAVRLRELGAPRVVAVAADIAEPEQVETVVAAHEQAYETMGALILNAGVGSAGPVAQYPLRRFDKTVAINLRAPLQLLQLALPALRKAAAQDPARGARIVALASLTGVFAEPGLAVYGATKAALISMIRTLNTEESGNGIAATTISPGYVDTDMSAWIRDRIAPEEMISVTDVVELVDALLRLSARAVVPDIVVSRAGTSGYIA